jgi:hypothetical protein
MSSWWFLLVERSVGRCWTAGVEGSFETNSCGFILDELWCGAQVGECWCLVALCSARLRDGDAVDVSRGRKLVFGCTTLSEEKGALLERLSPSDALGEQCWNSWLLLMFLLLLVRVWDGDAID